ncbi:hypothetical protein [Vibrio furnissii]|uniref:hypothetical protein n=1 Tax=Vibrio furnissii TaxID=29494 RepID=UPI001559278D|nr:hypothetical protein [Vibrio furnissii]
MSQHAESMKNIRKYKYGCDEAEVASASGVSGDLCKSGNGQYFFRVYHEDKSFTDYELNHDDLSVTISQDSLASFYKIKDQHILDHSPEVLGLEEV